MDGRNGNDVQDKELVSVIIPTFNRAKTIKDAIMSVLKQTYDYLEVIVVDDGSSDDTVKIVNSINDKRVRCLVNETNKGACYSRNRGIDFSKGSIIAFEDSDDIWLPDKLKRDIDELKKHKADAVFSSYLLNEQVTHPNVNLNESEDKVKTIFLNTCIGTPTLVVKKAVLEKERFDENLPRFQDYDLSIRLVSKYNVYFIPEVLVKVYASSDGITRNSQAAVKALDIIYKKYRQIIDNDLDIRYEMNIKRGKYTEKNGLNGSKFFLEAMHAKKNTRIVAEYIMSRLRIYSPMYKIYDKIRGNY